jgi:hypothetical protein
MKLRIQGNSIRLRLTVPEVRAIGDGNGVSESTAFAGPISFCYRLQPEHGDRVDASFAGNTLQVTVPLTLAKTWADDPVMVAMTGSCNETELLIEKDFACLDPRAGEDQTLMFTNPGTVC